MSKYLFINGNKALTHKASCRTSLISYSFMKHQHKQTGGEETMQLNSLVNECMKVVVMWSVSSRTGSY